MDQTNPRGGAAGSAPERLGLWRLLVVLGALLALIAMTMASCPVRERAGLDAGGPAYVETVAGAPPAPGPPPAPLPSSTSDSSGGIGTTTVTSAPLPPPERPRP